jgi:hypothetical protein
MDTERKRRVIVFFTSNRQKADEWDQGWGFTLGNLFAMRADDGNVTQGNSIGLPQNFKHLVVWVNGRRLREEVTNQHPQATDSADIAKLIDERAVKIFEHIKEQAGEANILVASHGWTALSITGAMSVTYHSNLQYKDRDGRIRNAYEEKLLPLSRVEPAKFAEQFDKVWKYLSSAPRLPALKHLSHRIIGHIFGPLAVDIQGIHQVEPFRRLEYARKIIESYRARGDHPFLKLLTDLCFLLSGSKKLQFQLQSQTVTVETDLREEGLPEVRELDKTERKALKEVLGLQRDIPCAKQIREICGLDNSWMPKANSWLANFLGKLDEVVAENNPGKLVELIMSEGKEFLQKCQELHRCFDELERLLPEYAEPPEEAP